MEFATYDVEIHFSYFIFSHDRNLLKAEKLGNFVRAKTSPVVSTKCWRLNTNASNSNISLPNLLPLLAICWAFILFIRMKLIANSRYFSNIHTTSTAASTYGYNKWIDMCSIRSLSSAIVQMLCGKMMVKKIVAIFVRVSFYLKCYWQPAVPLNGYCTSVWFYSLSILT